MPDEFGRVSPEDWVSTEDPATGSEFGGVPGLVQPPPHELDTHETTGYMKAVPVDEYVDGAWTSTYDVPPTQMVRP
jgi:hypothetical protein